MKQSARHRGDWSSRLREARLGLRQRATPPRRLPISSSSTAKVLTVDDASRWPRRWRCATGGSSPSASTHDVARADRSAHAGDRRRRPDRHPRAHRHATCTRSASPRPRRRSRFGTSRRSPRCRRGFAHTATTRPPASGSGRRASFRRGSREHRFPTRAELDAAAPRSSRGGRRRLRVLAQQRGASRRGHHARTTRSSRRRHRQGQPRRAHRPAAQRRRSARAVPTARPRRAAARRARAGARRTWPGITSVDRTRQQRVGGFRTYEALQQAPAACACARP